jgi:hypothetical protein
VTVAVLAAMGCAPPSAPGPSDTEAPGEVEFLTVLAGSRAVTLAWVDPMEGDLANVLISGPGQSSPQSVSPQVQRYTAAGLTNGTTYEFTVRTVDQSGNASAGTTVSATPAVQRMVGGSGDDEAYSLALTSGGGSIVAGSSGSTDIPYLENHGQRDLYIVKFDSAGAVSWNRLYGGIAADEGYSVQQTADGGYVVAGYSDSGGGYFPGDFYVLKLDANGFRLSPGTWERTYGGSSIDRARAVQQTDDNGYIVAGSSSSTNIAGVTNNGSADCYVVKLDANGDVTWQKMYGGSGADYACSIRQTSDGGYILAGSSSSTNIAGLTNSGDADVYVVKLDASGSVSWQTMFGGSLPDYANCIEETSDGGYVLGGSTQTALNGWVDCLVAKLDETGAISWQRSFGGNSWSWDWASCIGQASDGGYLVAGRKAVQMQSGPTPLLCVMKLDGSGTVAWERTYGGFGPAQAESLVQTASGHCVVAGYGACVEIPGVTNNGGEDFYIVELD